MVVCISSTGMETGLMFNCDLCSFRSVREDNYIAHIAEHKNESYPSNRHRNRNNPKPQVCSPFLFTNIMCDDE
jgi:hypothetical protein